MIFESTQLNLPPHVVKHILAAPKRWRSDGDLFKKQLKKLTTNERAYNDFLNKVYKESCFFPITAPVAPSFDHLKYPKTSNYIHVVDNIYAIKVL